MTSAEASPVVDDAEDEGGQAFDHGSGVHPDRIVSRHVSKPPEQVADRHSVYGAHTSVESDGVVDVSWQGGAPTSLE